MKSLFLPLILLLCCSSIVPAQKRYVINAKLTGFENNTKFYLKDLSKEMDIDSALIVNGAFTMKGKIENAPASFWLYTSYHKEFFYTVLFIGADNIMVSGDAKDFPFDLKIIGSRTMDQQNVLNNKIKDGYKKRNSLVNEYFSLSGDSLKQKTRGKEIWAAINKIDISDDSIRKAFISTHLNSYPALNELTYLKNKYDHETLQKMYNALQPEYRDSRFGKIIYAYLKVGEPLKRGDMYTDLSGQDRDGYMHKLSDIKNKYVLVDFSETYCGPCIQSIQEMKNVLQQYHDKLDILTYSGDSGKKTWLEGLNRDKPNWWSIWDGTGINGETSLKYGITGYPTFFLIDPKGKIVATKVGFGDGVLKKMIAENIK